MKTRKTLRRMDQALFQLQSAHKILVHARHSEMSASEVAETMTGPLDVLFDCLERLMSKK